MMNYIIANLCPPCKVLKYFAGPAFACEPVSLMILDRVFRVPGKMLDLLAVNMFSMLPLLSCRNVCYS